MHLYGEYLKEREGTHLIFNDSGFVSYRIEENEIFIKDFFITKESRGGFVLKRMISDLVSICKKENKRFLTATIHDFDHGRDRTLKAALKLGFKFLKAHNGFVVIALEVF